jgi:heme-degrading monooxygenase HmoA
MRTVTLVHHRVRDFEAWKQVYDGVREVQRDGGVRFHQVLRSADDPTMVVVTHAFDSREAAEAFFDQEELKAALAQSGVDLSSMRLEYLDEIEAGDL